MECDICSRIHDADKLPFLCAIDARNSIYDGRIKSLHALLELEDCQKQIEAMVTRTPWSSRIGTEQTLAEQRIIEDRTSRILAAAEKLRQDINDAREEIKNRKAALARRKTDLDSVSAGLVQRRANQQEELDKVIRKTRFQWAQKAEVTANTRAFLCTEAVRLYGLKRSKKGGSGRYDYVLGRVPVVDLTGMDSSTPEIISTSLAHIAHILVLVCHYLSIRLPAEITLPHRDYPRPTIFNLSGSYQRGPGAFPGSFSDPTSLREADARRNPRPRPLFVDKPLTQLAKDDPPAYSFFLEGVTLLAYDIAWLCCCQGVAIGDTSNFEDICNMGKNLYGFLMSAQTHDLHPFNVSKPGLEFDGEETAEDRQGNWFGRYSHGGAFYFLASPEGAELIKTFKLPSPMKLTDRLKKKLIGDAPTPDWEVLDDDAWKVEDIPTVGAESLPKIVTRNNQDGNSAQRVTSNGWTKVKPR